MFWYHSVLNICSVLFCLILLRYHWYRTKFFLHTFQQVGYKQNEFWAWLKDHWDEKTIPLELGIINLLLFLVIAMDAWFELELTKSSIAVSFFIFGLFWLGSVKRYRQEKVKKPLVLTSRVKRLLIPIAILTLIFPLFFTYSAFTGRVLFTNLAVQNFDTALLNFDVVLLAFGWVFGAILIPFIVWISGQITRPVEARIQEGFKEQARKKLASMPHLKVIAITGSYGKTSTKFMVRDLLKERFSVCSTPGSFNTPMGICKVINNDLQSHHQILILEMGARYAGNIQELCDIATPDIGIVTNVGVAHLETFGGQEVIAKEKGTLIDNVKSGGVAVLNADDRYVSRMGESRSDLNRIMVGLDTGVIQARDISYDTEGTRFVIQFEEKVEEFRTKLLGAHNVQNMLLAIGVAHHLGIRPKTMTLGAANIEPVEHRLELKKAGQFFVIDDAFNSNPVGAKNAVEILSQFNSGRRIIITPGMVELGELEYEENKNFGKAIGQANLDLVVLVGEDRSVPIQEGISEIDGQSDKVRVVTSLFEANELVHQYVQAGDVVLYENDLPDVYNEG